MKNFFAGLFVTTIIGMQMAEAERIKCPDAASIQHTIVQGKHGFLHKYTGFSTGARKIIFVNMDHPATDPQLYPQGHAEAASQEEIS